jgi:hypothetical protein
MSKVQLFDRERADEQYTDAGRDLDEELHKALMPIFKKYDDKGMSIRDITAIAQWVVFDVSLDTVLNRNDK